MLDVEDDITYFRRSRPFCRPWPGEEASQKHRRAQQKAGGWCTVYMSICKRWGVGNSTDKNSLTTVDQFPQEPDDVIGRLPIQTGSRLIQEQQSRFGNQLNTKSDSLALLNTQTSTRDYIICISTSNLMRKFDNMLPPIRASRIPCNSKSSIM